jgi:hypothetical protein
MKQLLNILLAFLILGTVISASEIFVNWRAGYYVEMPDDWYHVPYSTVNIFLQTQDVNSYLFDYDAVIAWDNGKPFFESAYIFLVFHETGQLNETQIDSVLKVVESDYETKVTEGSLESGSKTFRLKKPVYDKSRYMVAVKDRITSEHADKYMMEIRKFYEKGVAVFLCYAYKEFYNDVQPIFVDIVNSLSTEDLESVAPRDSIQVVDVTDKELTKYSDEDRPSPGSDEGLSGSMKTWFSSILVALVVVLIVRIIIRKKKTK